MIEKLIDDMNRALNTGAYLSALCLALTFPDICGKAEYGDDVGNKKRYTQWYDEFVGQYEKSPKENENDPDMPYLSGAVVYISSAVLYCMKESRK